MPDTEDPESTREICLKATEQSVNCGPFKSVIQFFQFTIFAAVLVLVITMAALTFSTVVRHHYDQSQKPYILLSVNQSAIHRCSVSAGGGLLLRAAAAAGIASEQRVPPCITAGGLLLTAFDKPLGPLIRDNDNGTESGDFQTTGFLLTGQRDGIIVLRNGIYVTHSSVTFFDDKAENYATLSLTVNNEIRLDCASHSAHKGTRNPFTVCALNGLLKLRRGDIVRFLVRSSYRSINLHNAATHFSIYQHHQTD